MKTLFKNILVLGVLALGAMALEAAQPVVWTLNLTNSSLVPATVSTVASNGITAATFTSGSSTGSNFVDTLQASSGTVSSWFLFTPTGLMTGNPNNSVTTYWSGSEDLISWKPWTNNVANCVAGTTNQFAGYLKLDLSPFRYIAPTAIVYSATNGFCTNVPALFTNSFGTVTSNSAIQIKVLLKGP